MTTMSTQHDIDVLYMYMYNKFRYGAPQKMFSTCNQMALIRVNILHSINFKLLYIFIFQTASYKNSIMKIIINADNPFLKPFTS